MSIQRLSNAGQSGYRYKTLIAGITPVASVPVIGDATALTDSTASVAFTAPGSYGATSFTATSSPGGFIGTSATSPITVSGLSELTSYTFTVTATNATGTSSPSAASNSITTLSAFAPVGSYYSLATVMVPSGGTSSSITFSGIPTDYKHLQIRGVVKGAETGDYFYNGLRMGNGTVDTGNSYAWHNLAGDGGGTASSTAATSQSNIRVIPISSTQAMLSNNFSAIVVDILDYQSTTKLKTVRSRFGHDNNGTGSLSTAQRGISGVVSGVWQSTSAVTAITFYGYGTTNNNFGQYTQFALYGVK